MKSAKNIVFTMAEKHRFKNLFLIVRLSTTTTTSCVPRRLARPSESSGLVKSWKRLIRVQSIQLIILETVGPSVT